MERTRFSVVAGGRRQDKRLVYSIHSQKVLYFMFLPGSFFISSLCYLCKDKGVCFHWQRHVLHRAGWRVCLQRYNHVYLHLILLMTKSDSIVSLNLMLLFRLGLLSNPALWRNISTRWNSGKQEFCSFIKSIYFDVELMWRRCVTPAEFQEAFCL